MGKNLPSFPQQNLFHVPIQFVHRVIFLLDFWKGMWLAYISIVRKGFPDLLEIVKNGAAAAGAAGKEGVQVVHWHQIILRQFTAGQTLHRKKNTKKDNKRQQKQQQKATQRRRKKEGVQVVHLHQIILSQFTAGQTLHQKKKRQKRKRKKEEEIKREC